MTVVINIIIFQILMIMINPNQQTICKKLFICHLTMMWIIQTMVILMMTMKAISISPPMMSMIPVKLQYDIFHAKKLCIPMM